MAEFWVFGYGSLMWNPGFVPAEAGRARLCGYHRGLCVQSHVHRGTPLMPGLVLGLDRGGACVGLAMRVKTGERDRVYAYLRERELVTDVYHEKNVRLELADGRMVAGLAFVVDRNHAQYAGRPETGRIAEIVARASGKAGDNREYVANTLAHLRSMGIVDHQLEAVGKLLRLLP